MTFNDLILINGSFIMFLRGDIMANKELKNRTPCGSAIDTKIYNDLKAYSKETGIPVSKLLDKSISLFLESIKK